MRAFAIIFIALVCLGLISLGNVYGLPFVSPEYSYDTAKHVIVGRVISVEFLKDPNSQYFDQKYREMTGLALYEIQVEEYMKNPMENPTIQVIGRYIDQKQTLYYERFPYEINQRVLLYLKTSDNPQYDLFIDPRSSRVISEDFSPKQMLEDLKNKSAPLQQIKFGLSVNEIVCKNNLILIQKYDGSPACVTESTKLKLIERGWTTKDSSAQEIIERLKQNTQPVNEVDARYIETLALMNQTVSNFVYGTEWTAHCCGYSENDDSYEITITFLNLENHKQLGVTFDAETMKITDIQHSDAINIGKGLSSEPDPYRLVALREFPDESAYYHKINSLSEIPYLPEINENKTTIITSEQFNDLLEWFPQKCLENNSDSYNCSNTPPIFEYNSVKYLIVSHELDSTEVYCESGLLYVVNYEKEFPDRKLDDFVPAKC